MKQNGYNIAQHTRIVIGNQFSISFISNNNFGNRSFCNLIFRISHCQTTMTFQPCFSNSKTLRLSRSIFPTILEFQNSILVVGNVPHLQACPCQKQPQIKTTVAFRKNNIRLSRKAFYIFLESKPVSK